MSGIFESRFIIAVNSASTARHQLVVNGRVSSLEGKTVFGPRAPGGLPATAAGSAHQSKEAKTAALAEMHPSGIGVDQQSRGCEGDAVRHSAVGPVQARHPV